MPGMNFRRAGYSSMPTTFTISQDRVIQIIAKTLGISPEQVHIDPTEQGPAVTITTDDPGAPLRAENMFKRWAKGPKPKKDAN